ncbi:unnamed protein product [Somion occarium]|uniref:PH domain-containing protein n=1 Tax=Somion occarium TaxID=3059160 RepID=A0ABP1DYB4_9APHY
MNPDINTNGDSALTRRPNNYPYAAMPSYTLSRPMSPPTSTRPFRFSTQQHRDIATTATTSANGHANPRRASRIPELISADGHAAAESETDTVASSSFASVGDPFAAHPSHSQSTSFVTYEPPTFASSRNRFMSRPSTANHTTANAFPEPTGTTTTTISSSPTRRRGSILVAASDALSSLSFARRKRSPPLSRSSFSPSSHHPNNHPPIIFSEVIEISAETVNKLREEERERERLRDAAAQTLGLGPVLLEDELKRKDEENSDDVQVGIIAPSGRGHDALGDDDDDLDRLSYEEDRLPENDITGFGNGSLSMAVTPTLTTPTQSLPPPTPTGSSQQTQPPASPILPLSMGRARSGSHSHTRSIGRHSPSNSFSRSLTPLPSSSPVTPHTTGNGFSGSPTTAMHQVVPPFPATSESLKPHISLSGTFPKHYPPSSLLRFAFGTKQWKVRYVVLTTPAQSYSPTTPTGRPSTASSSTGSGGGMPAFRTNVPPSPSYLHLFKSSSSNATEMERLEINEDSVVFIADHSPLDSSAHMSQTTMSHSSSSTTVNPGRRSADSSSSAAMGKKGVIQVGGVDVGLHVVTGSTSAGKQRERERDVANDVDGSGSGRTMWLLQITDSEEAKKWIGAIKGIVLSQRSLRAGIPHSSAGAYFESPRGDLDVVLSIRAQQASLASSSQSRISSSSNDHTATITPRMQSPVQSLLHGSDSGLSPPSTLSRSHSRGTANTATPNATTSGSRTGGGGAVSALKGLFTSSSTRPRSPSSASVLSIGSSRDATSPANSLDIMSPPKATEESSFGSVATNLLMLRSSSISSASDNQRMGAGYNSPTSSVFSPISPSTPITATSPTASTGSPSKLSEHHRSLLIDRKILPDEERNSVDDIGPTFAGLAGRNSLLVGDEGLRTFGSPSLQPPPRRRAWTSSGLPTFGSKGNGSIPSPNTLSALTPPTSAVAGMSLVEVNESRSTSPPPVYSYSHANGSTAESFGVGVLPRPSNSNGSATGSGNGSTPLPSPSTEGSRSRVRMSWSSASSFASNDPTSSPEIYSNSGHSSNTRRWSRHNSASYQNHHRLTPPSGSPPSVSPLSPSPPPHSHRSFGNRHHPYLVDHPSPGSRSSSTHSSPPSLVLDLRPLSPKRTSGSSVQSFNTTSTGHSRGATPPGIGMAKGMFRRNSHRMSVPPPQRPVPISALPPTPGEDPSSSMSSVLSSSSSPPTQASSAPASKTSFREILTSRSHRLSLSPPTQPPSSSLPPRPDEPGFRPIHRKSLSNGSPPNPLYSIPASPNPVESPYPPPGGPLPPTPTLLTTPTQSTPIASSAETQQQPPQASRQSKSFVRRLRILSAPSTSPPSQLIPPAPLSFDDSPRPIHMMPSDVPSTPIGEPITTFQDDLDDLSDSPIIPPAPPRTLPIPINSPPPEISPSDEMPRMTSLSPPPRRGSRRVTTPDKEKLEHEVVRLSSIVTLKDLRRSHEETPAAIPSPLPPSPLSPPHPDHPSIQLSESLDHAVEPDNISIDTGSPSHSSHGHSAVSLIDVSI